MFKNFTNECLQSRVHIVTGRDREMVVGKVAQWRLGGSVGKVAQWRPRGHGLNPYIPQVASSELRDICEVIEEF